MFWATFVAESGPIDFILSADTDHFRDYPTIGSVHSWNDQFCFLVLTDFSTCIHSLLLCFIMTARSLSTATFDIPSGIRLVGEILSGASAGDRRSQKCAGRVRISWRKAADAERADGRIDDDMRLEALKQTNYIKAIVTAKGKMDAIGNQSDRK